ncbi:MAG: hypothetical protein ACRDJS_03220 [Actinomycetota bacterium]
MILVNDVLKSESELAAQERFGQCMRRHGVPARFTVAASKGSPGGTIEDAFFGWVAKRTNNGQTSPSGVEDAPLHVKCGRPLWDTRERLLKDRRETYVEGHRDRLAELSELVQEAGD